ncbi:MAG TPA: hypothetical protein VMB84_07995 [Stellaceae bacterium]|nr:hypothetical protein [Stellaceae bacterium]
MERKRWETALRCLEVALHPNTGADEALAAIAGFRRMADGVPLHRIAEEFAADSGAEAARWQAALDRLERDNRMLRRRLGFAEAAGTAAAEREASTGERIAALEAALAAAEERAIAAEDELTGLRAAYARRLDGESPGTIAPPPAPEAAPRATPPAAPNPAPFRDLLADARRQAEPTPRPRGPAASSWLA